MNTRHTPGPWRRSSVTSRDEYATIILGPSGQIVARAQVDINTDAEEAEENAAIISRAPEYLIKLENATRQLIYNQSLLRGLMEERLTPEAVQAVAEMIRKNSEVINGIAKRPKILTAAKP
jgi:hypothetical protein